MKFVCDQCQTRYSIADDKVRQKVLKIRCKACGNVITVQESSATPDDEPVAEAAPKSPGGPVAPRPALGAAAAPLAAAASKPSALAVAPNPLGAGVAPRPAAGAAAALSQASGVASKPLALSSSPFGASPPKPPASAAAPAPPPVPHVDWHLSVNGQTEGPFALVALAKRIMALPATDEAYVWNDRMDGWKEPKDVPAVARELAALRAVPPPPRPAAAPLPRPMPAPPPPRASAAPGSAPHLPGPGTGSSAGRDSGLRSAPPPLASATSGARLPTSPSLAAVAAPSATPARASLPAPGAGAASTRLPSRPILPAVSMASTSTASASAASPPAATGVLEEEEGERTSISPFSAAQVAALMETSGSGPHGSIPSTDVSLDSAELKGPPPQAPAGATSSLVRAPAVAPPGRRPSFSGLEALDFGQPQGQPHMAETPPPLVLSTSLPPVGGFTFSPDGPSIARGPGASQPFFPPPLVTGPALTTGSGAFSMANSMSGLSKVLPRPNVFARNPALKFGTFAAVLAGLIIVVVTLSLREPEKKSVTKASGAATGGPEDPEALARRLAEERFRSQVGVAETRAEVAGAASRRAPPRGPAPARPTPAPGAVEPPPAAPLEPPPATAAAPLPDETGGVTKRFAQAERSISSASVQRARAAGPAASFNQADVTAVIKRRENQDAIKICYERALKRDSRMQGGRLDVTVTIGSSGMVRGVEVEAPSDLNAVSACVKATVKRWHFPASNEEYGTSFPFVFQRDSSG